MTFIQCSYSPGTYYKFREHAVFIGSNPNELPQMILKMSIPLRWQRSCLCNETFIIPDTQVGPKLPTFLGKLTSPRVFGYETVRPLISLVSLAGGL